MKSESFRRVLSIKGLKRDELNWKAKMILKRIESDSLRGIIYRSNLVKSEEKLDR